MTLIEQARQQSQQIQQTFLERVNLLFEDIEEWAAEKQLLTYSGEVQITEKVIGTYSAPTLSLYTPQQEELVQIMPQCAFVIVAEGIVHLNGKKGSEHIAYLRPNEQTIYHIRGDNWYWIEYSLPRNKAHAMRKELFFYLLAVVSSFDE
jgi:hypothetical protein